MRFRHAVQLITLASAVVLLTTTDALNAHEHGVLKLANRELVVGDNVPLVGEKFTHRGSITLFLTGIRGKVRLQQVRTDEKGTFNISLHVPGDLSVGDYRLVAIAPDGDEVASLDVSVTTHTATPGPATGMADAHPTAAPLGLQRARSPWVTGLATLAIALSLIGGTLLLRRPGVTQTGLVDRHDSPKTRSP